VTSRRDIVVSIIAASSALSTPNKLSAAARSGDHPKAGQYPVVEQRTREGDQNMQDQAEDPRITRARLSGPECVTKGATVAEIGGDGAMNILAKGSNEWICVPGDDNRIGAPPMCMNPMGMRWMMDAMQGKARPSNSSPGMIYMLCGATQRSNVNPFDKTSAAIPIGPHWMITWPFDAEANGLPTTIRDKGAWVMFAGTPYSYLHICGTPWDGTEYQDGGKAIWSMTYSRP
jgi:hypothetical protein